MVFTANPIRASRLTLLLFSLGTKHRSQDFNFETSNSVPTSAVCDFSLSLSTPTAVKLPTQFRDQYDGIHRVRNIHSGVRDTASSLMQCAQLPHLPHIEKRHSICRQTPQYQLRRLDGRARERALIRHRRTQSGGRQSWRGNTSLGRRVRIHRLPWQRCQGPAHRGGTCRTSASSSGSKRPCDPGESLSARPTRAWVAVAPCASEFVQALLYDEEFRM